MLKTVNYTADQNTGIITHFAGGMIMNSLCGYEIKRFGQEYVMIEQNFNTVS